MNHADWKDLIPFYIAGTLSKTEMLQLERHLAECVSCRQDVNDWSPSREDSGGRAKVTGITALRL
jgi:anti-sigma factor RsiW